MVTGPFDSILKCYFVFNPETFKNLRFVLFCFVISQNLLIIPSFIKALQSIGSQEWKTKWFPNQRHLLNVL